MAVTDAEVRDTGALAVAGPREDGGLVVLPAVVPARRPPGLWDRARQLGPALAFVVLLGLGWQAMASIINIQLLPGLGPIWSEVRQLVVSGQFFEQLRFTMERIVIGFAIVLIVATTLGIAMGRNTLVRRFLEPAVLVGLTIPSLVWAFLCIIWFGLGLGNPVMAVALSASPKLIVNISQGMRSLDPELIEMSHVFRFSRLDRLRYVWIPRSRALPAVRGAPRRRHVLARRGAG